MCYILTLPNTLLFLTHRRHNIISNFIRYSNRRECKEDLNSTTFFPMTFGTMLFFNEKKVHKSLPTLHTKLSQRKVFRHEKKHHE